MCEPVFCFFVFVSMFPWACPWEWDGVPYLQWPTIGSDDRHPCMHPSHLFLRFFFFFLRDRGSLCISVCLGTHYVNQAVLELAKICLPCVPPPLLVSFSLTLSVSSPPAAGGKPIVSCWTARTFTEVAVSSLSRCSPPLPPSLSSS